MTLEKSIEQTLANFLTGGIIEEKVEKKLGEAVDKALDDLFSWHGGLKKAMESKIEGMMLPIIEGNDFSAYTTKLEAVLIKVLQETTFDNIKVLENFKELAVGFESKEVKLSVMFEKWCEYVSKAVETEKLEVEYDDKPYYETVNCTFDVEIDEGRSWSSFKYATVRFECADDENLNVEFRISNWRDHDKHWDLEGNSVDKISSLRRMNEFDVYLLNLTNCRVNLILDEDCGEEDVRPAAEPEATFY